MSALPASHFSYHQPFSGITRLRQSTLGGYSMSIISAITKPLNVCHVDLPAMDTTMLIPNPQVRLRKPPGATTEAIHHNN
jgi:hypothetical protein